MSCKSCTCVHTSSDPQSALSKGHLFVLPTLPPVAPCQPQSTSLNKHEYHLQLPCSLLKPLRQILYSITHSIALCQMSLGLNTHASSKTAFRGTLIWVWGFWLRQKYIWWQFHVACIRWGMGGWGLRNTAIPFPLPGGRDGHLHIAHIVATSSHAFLLVCFNCNSEPSRKKKIWCRKIFWAVPESRTLVGGQGARPWKYAENVACFVLSDCIKPAQQRIVSTNSWYFWGVNHHLFFCDFPVCTIFAYFRVRATDNASVFSDHVRCECMGSTKSVIACVTCAVALSYNTKRRFPAPGPHLGR